MQSLFSVSAKQVGSYTQFTGVSYSNLSKDIERFYSTSLVTRYQILKESWDRVRVHNFFLVELHEILKELLKVRNLRSRRRALSDLKQVIETETWIKDTLVPSGPPFDFSRLDVFHKKPFPNQREFLEQYPLITHSYHLKGLLLDAAVGSGKAQPYSTRVKTLTGWSKIGDLVPGSEVLTPTGKVTTVTAVHPQGVTDVYRFVFEDGRRADSHPEHLWKVDEISKIGGELNISRNNVTTTQDIVDHFQDYRYEIPLVGELGGIESTDDLAVIDIANEILLATTPIDERVLEMSYSDRLNTVKSLLQRSGCQIAETGVCFITPNPSAAKSFQQLIWSLGGVAFLTDTLTSSYRVEFYHRAIKELVEGLVGPGLVLEEIIDISLHLHPTLSIMSIEKRPEEETICISIEDIDHLYIVDDYIVTHNTFTALCWSELMGPGKLFVVVPMNIIDSVWKTQIKEHYKINKRVWDSKSGLPLSDQYDIYIVHYDYLVGQHFGYLREFLLKLKKSEKHGMKLVLDESHNFNEIKAKQTQRLVELCDLELFIGALPISGTPLKAMGGEAYPVLCMIDKLFIGKAREYFIASYGRNRPALNSLLSHRIGRSKFTIPEATGMGPAPDIEVIKVKIPGSDKYTLDALRLEMQMYIQERFAFYNHHMPTYVEFYLGIVKDYEFDIQRDPKALAELDKYRKIVNRFRKEGYNSFTDSVDSVFCKGVEEKIEARLRGSDLHDFRNVKSAVKYLGLKLRGEALGNVLGRARINAVREVIQHAGLPEMINDVERKTVVFTSYVDVLKVCEKYLGDMGFKPITVHGEVNKDRDSSIKLFGVTPSINPLIATFDSLKEGYPLLMANQIIMLNAPFREYEVRQVKARIWRIGQEFECFFRMIDLDTGDKLNITSRSINILEWSREQVDALISKTEGHILFGDVTGDEMYDMSYEPVGKPITKIKSMASLFV